MQILPEHQLFMLLITLMLGADLLTSHLAVSVGVRARAREVNQRGSRIKPEVGAFPFKLKSLRGIYLKFGFLGGLLLKHFFL